MKEEKITRLERLCNNRSACQQDIDDALKEFILHMESYSPEYVMRIIGQSMLRRNFEAQETSPNTALNPLVNMYHI